MMTKSSPELKSVEAALQEYDGHVAHYERLLKQQTELASAIEAAIRNGDPEDAEFVRRLSQDRTRLDMLPAKITQAENALRATQDGLYQALLQVSRVLGQANADAHAAAKARLESTLRELLTHEGTILRMVDLGFQFSKSVQRTAQLAGTFSPTSLYEAQHNGPALSGLANHLLRVFSPKTQPATV